MMTGHTNKPRPSLIFCFHKGLHSPIWTEYLFHVLFGSHIMDLPQVKMVRIHIPQGFTQMSKSPSFIPCMRFAGEKYLLSPLI